MLLFNHLVSIRLIVIRLSIRIRETLRTSEGKLMARYLIHGRFVPNKNARSVMRKSI